MAEAVLPDGSVIKVPDFALENTQAQMLATLKVLLKGDKETQSLYEKFLKEVEDGNKDRKKAEDKAHETLKEIKKVNEAQSKSMRQKFADRVEGDVQGVFVGAGRAVSGLATAAVLATGAIIGFGAKIFTGLTDNLRDLTQAGLGFTDSLGNTAGSAIVQFNQLGYSTQEATQTMLKFASLTATLGRSGPGSLVNTMKSFKALTNNGLDLGMSFKDANEALLEELETRSNLGMLEGSVSSRQLASANEQIKLQTAYASVLGISADKLREMNKQTLSQNTGLVALMSKFGPKMYEGAAAFNTVMASRGEQLAKVSQLFLDAGAQSSVFISEAARDLASAGVGEVTDTLIAFGNKLQRGELNNVAAGEAAALQLQKKIGSLNNKQIQNLQRVVEAGGAGAEAAKTILLAYLEVKETERKMAEVARRLGMGPGKIDELLAARIKFDNSIAEIKGAFDALMMQVMISFTPMMGKIAKTIEKIARAFKDGVDGSGNKIKGIGTALIEGAEKIGTALMKLFGFDPSDAVDSDTLRTSVVDKIDRFATRISNFINSLTERIDKYTTTLKDGSQSTDWSGMFKDIGKDIAAGILNGIGDFLWDLPGMLFNGALTLITNMFTDPPEGQEEIGNTITDGVLKIVGALFAAGAIKSIAAVGIGKLKDMAKGAVFGESTESLSKKRSGGLWDRIRGKTPDAPGGPSAPGAPGGKTPNAPGGKTTKAPGSKTASSGKSNAGSGIASLLTNLGKGLGGLGKGLGDFLKGIGKGAGAGLQAIFSGLGKGIATLGNPKVLLGSAALGIISGAVFIAGKAFQQFQGLDWKTIGMGLTAIAGIGVIAGVAGAFAPALLAGALAIGAIGLALQLFPVDTLQTFGNILNTVVNTVMVGMPPIINAVGDALAKLVEVGAKGFDTIMNSVGTLLERLSKLDAANLAASALAITGVGVALAGLGTGSVIGGIGNFFGSLFGGGDPFDRLLKVADAAVKFDGLTSRLTSLAGVMGQTADIIKSLDPWNLEKIVTEFTRLWENLASVELNTQPYYDFAAISTKAMLRNADAINKIAGANRAQNLAYAEFIKLDEAKFAKNVKNAYNYNAANAGATEEGGLSNTVKNIFNSLFGTKPATPVDPSKITPTTPQSKNVTESPLLSSLQTPIDKDSTGRTPAIILESVERALKSVIDGGKLKVKES